MKIKGTIWIQPLERKLLAEQVARHLIDLITKGELQPGQRLPSERELATLLNVGRPAVREALRSLHLLNIVDIRHGDGTYVTSLEPDLLIRPFDIFLSLGSLTREHLFEARTVLEVGIMGLAASRITDDDISDLEQSNAAIARDLDDPAKFTRLDEEWHRIIFRAISNPLLKSVMESVTTLHRMTREWTAQSLAVRSQAVEDHAQIIAALRNRDPGASVVAMTKHLENVRRLSALGADSEVQGQGATV